jgi:hypothetical protein
MAYMLTCIFYFSYVPDEITSAASISAAARLTELSMPSPNGFVPLEWLSNASIVSKTLLSSSAQVTDCSTLAPRNLQ